MLSALPFDNGVHCNLRSIRHRRFDLCLSRLPARHRVRKGCHRWWIQPVSAIHCRRLPMAL